MTRSDPSLRLQDRHRRRVLQAMLLTAASVALSGASCAPSASSCARPWPSWRSFVARHMEDDGRVVDFFYPDLRSTSESQSYALFFALVDNDQGLFDRVLEWTQLNLSAGRLDLNLPAWLWGKSDDGRWGVLDGNTASDADLWIAYTLAEAGRLWARPELVGLGRRVLALARAQEVLELPGFGLALLPGKQGFVQPDRWTLNPCYLPLFMCRRFAGLDPPGRWDELAERNVEMIHGSAPAGFAPDWIAWNGKAFVTDPAKGGIGSYDAIRTYLWAGMVDAADPLRNRLLSGLDGPLRMLQERGHIAEKIDRLTGHGSGNGPAGFAASLLPYLAALEQPALLASQAALIPSGQAAESLSYYDRMLVLFGQGWHERRYRFSADGKLLPAWSPQCPPKP